MVRTVVMTLAMVAASTAVAAAPATAGPATAQCPTAEAADVGVKVPLTELPVTVSVRDTTTDDPMDVVVTFTDNGTRFTLNAPESEAYTVVDASWCGKSATVTTTPLIGDGTTGGTPAVNKKGSAQKIGYVSIYTVTTQATGGSPLFSFEGDVEGWSPAPWQGNAGTVAPSSDFATHGTGSLQVTTADGGWFGAAFDPPADLTGKARLKLDLGTTTSGTSTNMALQLGESFTWCQSSWGWVNPGTTTTVEFDLTTLSCSAPELGNAKNIWIWLSGGGVFSVDNVRAE